MSFLDQILGRGPAPLPPFLHKFDIPGIAASGNVLYTLNNQLRSFRKWAPWTIFSIQNLSPVDLTIRFNYTDASEIEVASGGFQTRKNQPFCNFMIINQSASAAVDPGKVTAWIERIP